MTTKSVTSIEYLKDTFQIGYTAFRESRVEAEEVWNLYHNRHYTPAQLSTLAVRGQPAETFNVVKLFARMLLGYYSTIVNTVQASPVGIEDVPTTSVLNDLINYTMRANNFNAEGEKVKLSAMVAGLMCVFVNVKPTGKKDEFGRPHYEVVLEHVPESELVLDAMSRKDDYSDGRYIHRFRWMSEESVITLFGQVAMEKLTQYFNFTNQPDAEYSRLGRDQEVGIYKVHNNYLIVHSIVKDLKGKTWSVFWSDGVILKKTEISHKDVKFTYRVLKTHTSERAEYYGIFREVVETQKAINQALIKLQLLVNTQKAFVQDGAVENITDFTNAFNRVSAVIPVKELGGIKVVDLSREALEQYQIIDKAFDRVKRILSITDSFLGQAFASDSARKVKLQQNSSVVALRYLTGRIETFYRFLGWDIANLIKQYYTSHQVLRIADEATGQRWIEVNKPLRIWTGKIDQRTGQPIMQIPFEEHLDPATGKPQVDEKGNQIIAPIPEKSTEIAYSEFDIEIHANSYGDEDEKNQLLLEQVLSGTMGQLLSQVNPAGFFKAASLSMKSVKTKNSPEIANIFEQTAQMLGGDPQAQQQASGLAQQMPGQLAQQSQGPQSGAATTTLNLPQNTNEVN